MKARSGLVALPLALALVNQVVRSPLVTPTSGPTKPAVATSKAQKAGTAREFSISLNNLRDFANTVVVTFEDVRIEGRSDVHPRDSDCELHFGAHAPSFRGIPDGLVLEPMNACVRPFPGKSEKKDADWEAFGDRINIKNGKTVKASGVPRIWPEHLKGGGEDGSNPDHAVELHPLTRVVTASEDLDFAPNVFAGGYRGGVKDAKVIQGIVQRTTVSVTKTGEFANISFTGGKIGNFTVLDIIIDGTSITSDGEGSFRMNGDVVLDDLIVSVRIVTVQGSPINDEIKKFKAERTASIPLEALVLFSLSPESLFDAVSKSNGGPVTVERPLQLILYGTPDSE